MRLNHKENILDRKFSQPHPAYKNKDGETEETPRHQVLPTGEGVLKDHYYILLESKSTTSYRRAVIVMAVRQKFHLRDWP